MKYILNVGRDFFIGIKTQIWLLYPAGIVGWKTGGTDGLQSRQKKIPHAHVSPRLGTRAQEKGSFCPGSEQRTVVLSAF